MNSAVKNIPLVLRSARLVLWLPILVNVGVLSFLLTHSWQDGCVLGLSLSCVAAFGFLINDVWDLRVDQDNHAGKLESASKHVLSLAVGFAVFFLVAGLALSAFLGMKAGLAMFTVAAGLAAYTFWVRPQIVLANILSAILSSTPVWLPNVVFGHTPGIPQWIIIVVSIAMLLGREIIFDVADFYGDARAKRRTLPILFGKQMATRIAVAWQLSACALLTVWSVMAVSGWSPVSRLMLWVLMVVFALLVVPVNVSLFTRPDDATLIHSFTSRTRIAMLLLPFIMLAFMS